jgi:hypothetical protein
MLDENKIMTLHPQGKKGVNISFEKYDTVKTFILDKVDEAGEISYKRISDLAVEELQPYFDGKVVWYIVSVKLDLEARNIIERIPKRSPHEIRRIL